MRPETPGRRVGARVLAALGLCCSFLASCGPPEIVLDFRSGSGGTGAAGSTSSTGTGGSGGSSTSSTGGGDVCGENTTCEPTPTHPFASANDFMLLSVRPAGQPAPACPDQAPQPWKDGFAEFVKATCPVCTCQSPKGSCELPATLRAYDTSVCPHPANEPYQPFDAPMGWSGSCTGANPVPGCSGNNCIQGLTIDPPVVNDPPACEPGIPTPMEPVPAHWGKEVRACRKEPPDYKCGEGHFCMPTPPPEFMACYRMLGMNLVPDYCSTYAPGYPIQVDVYNKAFKDTSTCSACTCGPPVGSQCSTAISVYTTASDCTGPDFKALVDSTQPYCGSVPPGTALLSKKADPPSYTPGTCTAMGGDLSGAAEPDTNTRTTFCCKN